eukprot:c17472_g1_i1.p1 GENE.c17472_g1_i1~~c17472_g1_i1.p1  ORF type:complete len:562 (+),score=115.71 c17472_g1_i1:29-1687(+)
MADAQTKKRRREDETPEERKQRKQEKRERKQLEEQQEANAKAEKRSKKEAAESKDSKSKDAPTKKSKDFPETVSSSPPPPKRQKTEKTEKTEPIQATAAEDEAEFRTQLAAMKIQNARDTNPAPISDFANTCFGPAILDAVLKNGYTRPTPTQAQSWPFCLAGRDIVSVAKTGSGKTCGFLLPAIHQLVTSGSAIPGSISVGRAQHAPFTKLSVLVLAPTRELAQQIHVEARKFGISSGVRSACLFGGSPKSEQIRNLRSGVHMVIATPGRLNDLIEIRCADVSNVNYLVLDEADRMLDMGFEPQIRTIIEKIPETRQSLFFTATWPREVQALANSFLKNPVMISLGDPHDLKANKSITQHIKVLGESEKAEALYSLLQEISAQDTKILVFVSQKQTCNELTETLWEKGMEVDCLHGDREQWERTKVTNQLRAGTLKLLVATDVAARGLDVKDIGVVINYDFPAGASGVEDYVHRIGRTGRANEKGVAYTFFTPKDSRNAGKLIQVLRGAGQKVPDELQSLVRGGGFGRGRGRGGFRGRGGWGGRGNFRGRW